MQPSLNACHYSLEKADLGQHAHSFSPRMKAVFRDSFSLRETIFFTFRVFLVY